MLLARALASLGLSYTAEAWGGHLLVRSVNAVQQAKEITGNVSDAEGPIIGAVVEKGATLVMVPLQILMVTLP